MTIWDFLVGDKILGVWNRWLECYFWTYFSGYSSCWISFIKNLLSFSMVFSCDSRCLSSVRYFILCLFWVENQVCSKELSVSRSWYSFISYSVRNLRWYGSLFSKYVEISLFIYCLCMTGGSISSSKNI